MLRTSYNAQKEEWLVDELISIMSQEEQSMKKGKGYVVQNASHKNVDKKRNLWKGKNTKVSFKKKSGEKNGCTSIPTVEESSGVKPKF